MFISLSVGTVFISKIGVFWFVDSGSSFTTCIQVWGLTFLGYLVVCRHRVA